MTTLEDVFMGVSGADVPDEGEEQKGEAKHGTLPQAGHKPQLYFPGFGIQQPGKFSSINSGAHPTPCSCFSV